MKKGGSQLLTSRVIMLILFTYFLGYAAYKNDLITFCLIKN